MNLRNVVSSNDGTKHTLITIDTSAVAVDVTLGLSVEATSKAAGVPAP